MKDLFCTFEKSLKLKKLGFDEPCFGYYTFNEFRYWIKNSVYQYDNCKNSLFNRNEISAPLKSQVFKFARDKHNIDAWIQPFMEEKNNKLILPDESYSYFIFKDGILIKDGIDFIDFEETENECINQLLKLIDEKV